MVAGGVVRIAKRSVGSCVTGTLGYAGSERWRDGLMLSRGLAVYRQAVGSGLAHVPFSLVLDLRMLAEWGASFSFAERVVEGVDRELRGRYENHVLNRLLRERCVQQALELLSFFRVQEGGGEAFALRADRLTIVLLERLAPFWPDAWHVNAAHLRELRLEGLEGEQVAASLEVLRSSVGGMPFEEQLGLFVDGVTGALGGRRGLAWAEVVRAEDLFELEHLEVLNQEYLRQQVRQLIQVRESLPQASPHDLPIREEVSEVETRFMDQSNYPTGGFAELTNRGSFENMVLSELIYMGEGVELRGDTRALGVDLFDVRFVEGELLFYARDSGQLLRKRRTLRMVIDMRSPLHVKYPEHPFPLGTMVVGVALALVRDLVLLFMTDALRFSFQLLYTASAEGEAPDEVVKMGEVLRLMLDGPIQHGILEVVLEEAGGGWDPAAYASWDRKGYVIGFTSQSGEAEAWAGAIDAGRKAHPPLFGAVVALSSGAGEEGEAGTLIHLDLATSTLAALKRLILVSLTQQ